MAKGKVDKDKAFNELVSQELDTMEIFLIEKAARTSITLNSYIRARQRQGASLEAIRADLLTDLEEGGRIFGEFRNAVKATAHGAINRLRDDAEFSELGIITKYRWVAVLVNTCPDCLERHGRVQAWEEWEAEGMPRTGHTVCKENCKCMLIPAETTELEPIMRSKK